MLHSLPDIRRCDEYADIDFKNEDEVKRFVRPSRWLSIDFGEGKRFLITYGSYHKGWFLRQLRERDDIELLEVEPFLEAIGR